MPTMTAPPGEVFSGLRTDTAQAVAERALALWQARERALAPLVGDKGFAILYARCIHLTQASYPWLAPDPPAAAGRERFAGLGNSLEGRSFSDALAASHALLATFDGMLAALIGAPLTNGILRATLPEET